MSLLQKQIRKIVAATATTVTAIGTPTEDDYELLRHSPHTSTTRHSYPGEQVVGKVEWIWQYSGGQSLLQAPKN